MKISVDCGDAELRGEIVGQGTPLLLIHGWPLDRRIFAPQIATLRRYFSVISYDRRGFGESSGEPDLRRELDDINRLLNSCTDQTVHLLGMSQGARIALRYAVTHPDRLRSLILQGVVIDGVSIAEPVNERIPTTDYAELIQQGRMEKFQNLWQQHPMMRVDKENKVAINLLNKILGDYRGADLLNYSEDKYSFSVDIMTALKQFKLPALLLTGARETMARKEYASRLLEVLPDVREVILANSGHLSNLTETEKYNQTIIDFCNEIESKINIT